jgi:hypothetical protein
MWNNLVRTLHTTAAAQTIMATAMAQQTMVQKIQNLYLTFRSQFDGHERYVMKYPVSAIL